MNSAFNFRRWRTNGGLMEWSGMLLAFSLPFGKMYVPPFIVLFALSVLITPGFGKGLPDRIYKTYLIAFAGFYLWHLAGMLWSTNWGYGLMDLEIKASLLVLPLLFLFAPVGLITRTFLRNIILSFGAGIFLSVIISSLHSLLLFFETGSFASFYYTQSSLFMHPSYLSMYIVFFLFALYEFRTSGSKTFWYIYIPALILVFHLNLLSSKAGFLTFFMALVFISADLIFRKKWKQILSMAILPVIVFGSSMFFFPASSQRVASVVNNIGKSTEELNNSGESTADRILIWKTALRLASDNLLIGQGTGDVKDALIASYKKEGLTYPVRFNLNAHNQFIQSLVALGIPALLLLIFMLGFPLWHAVRKKELVYAGFILFFGFNILVESMMEVQAGIVFFAFWTVLLWARLRVMSTKERSE